MPSIYINRMLKKYLIYKKICPKLIEYRDTLYHIYLLMKFINLIK